LPVSIDRLPRRRRFQQPQIDRFARKSKKERAAEQHSVSLNEAYEILRDPQRRGAYLLQLAGRAAPTEEARTIDDPELLMETLERREALSEASSLESVAALAAAVEETGALAVKSAFAADDLDAATRLPTRLRYLRKFAEEARARRAVLAEPST
jgi:molecular chaperone HscB